MLHSFAIFLVVGLLTLAAGDQVFADSLKAASKQRIGNYDVEMTTEPKNPTAGASPTDVLIRIAGVNGDDLVDVPIMMRLTKDGVELQRTNPIIVPYGHYTQEFTFAQSGRYVLYVDLNDNSYSGETLTFTFFINIGGSSDYLYIRSAFSRSGSCCWNSQHDDFYKRERKEKGAEGRQDRT